MAVRFALVRGGERQNAGLRIAKSREALKHAGEPLARRRRTPHGPYFGAGFWLKSGSSMTQVKFVAMLVLPL
jgi:hypothetical protein